MSSDYPEQIEDLARALAAYEETGVAFEDTSYWEYRKDAEAVLARRAAD